MSQAIVSVSTQYHVVCVLLYLALMLPGQKVQKTWFEKKVTVLSYECEMCYSFLSLFVDTVPTAEVI